MELEHLATILDGTDCIALNTALDIVQKYLDAAISTRNFHRDRGSDVTAEILEELEETNIAIYTDLKNRIQNRMSVLSC